MSKLKYPNDTMRAPRGLQGPNFAGVGSKKGVERPKAKSPETPGLKKGY